MAAATPAAASTYAASYDASTGVMLHIPTKEQILLMFYHELPSRAAAAAAVALFAAATAALLATTCRTRAWFMLAAVLTGAMEVAGYALRLRMMSEPEFFTYVVSYAFLIIAPVFLCLVEYVALNKLIERSAAGGEASSPSAPTPGSGSGKHRLHEAAGAKCHGLPTAAETMPQQGAAAGGDGARNSCHSAAAKPSTFARCVSWFLVLSEVACLGLQCAAGGPLTSKDAATREAGRRMMLAGLLLQLGFFTIFTVIVLVVHSAPRFGYRGVRQFGWVFGVLYASIGLIYLRNIFRVVEFVQGFDGYLATREAFFYGFDCAVVLAIMLLFAVFNYGYALGSALPHGGAAAAEAAAAAQQMPMAEVVPRASPRRRRRHMTLEMAVGVKEAVRAAMQSSQAAAAAAAAGAAAGGDSGSTTSPHHQLPR